MFLLQFLVGGRLDVTYFEPHPAYLDDIALGEPVAFDAFVGVVGVFDDLPEHAFWVLEEILVAD